MTKRFDLVLTELKLAPSRAKAQELIESGAVEVWTNGVWQICSQPSKKWPPLDRHEIRITELELLRFVARSGLKLEGALHHLNLDVTGFNCLDIGQSTGGFTDCLLQRGARHVVGIDVGAGQLHPKIKDHPQVLAIEQLNAKDLSAHADFQQRQNSMDLIVVDVSFISITKIAESVMPYLKNGGHFLSLIKPQFELGPSALNKRGVVDHPRLLAELEPTLLAFMANFHLQATQFFCSTLKGRDGNQEFFFYGKAAP
jgi:23S rRNA (cytidine1920-2'-O)/16S rRNA (cytidine1409-2'-O)-methyltransferase